MAHITVSVWVDAASSSVTVVSDVASFLCLCVSAGFVDCKFFVPGPSGLLSFVHI